jgi:hypothetical protein
LLARIEDLPDACPYSHETSDERSHAPGKTTQATITTSLKRVFRWRSFIFITCCPRPVRGGRGFRWHQGSTQLFPNFGLRI